ncbi:MAG TPA: DUF3857 domain-containing transglutaminase family protein [Blastocatellia bacterium]|nr:DUF3857 domain-containing transglutaminase family protein [Blastocatellia bacterium]
MIVKRPGNQKPRAPRLFKRALRWTGALTALAALFVFAALAMAANRSFTVAPPAAWVEPVALPAGDASDGATKAAYLLLDHQTRVSGTTVERYERRAKKIFTAAALSDAAQLEIEFEPSYQQLTIHHVRIQRGGQTIDALRPNDIKIINQEDELDQQLYNGRRSALIVLNDVRQNDVIDYAYTITGSNPVLAGRYADTYLLGDVLPVAHLRWRLLYPSQRKIGYKTRGLELTPTVRQLGTETECQWQRDAVAAIEYEDAAPSWYEHLPSVQLSEFATWGEVVAWALPLYKVKDAPSAALSQQIEQWRTKLATDEERLLAALRFVQDDVRYTGIEMGPYSHMPSQPSVVFGRRFGDCKDKSLLLATILDALGIDAAPALTNTDAQHTIADFQPSPYAFNHVIVRAVLDGRAYWLDPTITMQRGRLEARYNPNYKRALIIRDGVGELDNIPPPAFDEPTTLIKEVYTVLPHQQWALLTVTTSYWATDADAMRYRLARTSLAELGRFYLNYYANTDANIEQMSPPQADDDPQANQIIITEHYRIPDFLSQDRQLGAYRIDEEFGKPGIARRAAPLAVSHPVHIVQNIEVDMAESFDIASDSRVISDDFIRYEFRVEAQGSTLRLSYSYKSLADYVPAAEVAKHLGVMERVRNTLGYTVGSDPATWTMASSPRRSKVGWIDLLIGLFAVGLILGLVFYVRRNRVSDRRTSERQKEFKAKFRVGAGDSPEVAIPLSHESELLAQVGALRCGCGEIYYKPGATLFQQGLTYDGRRLLLVQLLCERCRQPRDVYYAPPLARGRG